MIVLDTNVVSALMQDQPDASIVNWLDRLPEESIWVTAISIFELRYGIEILPASRRRRQLEIEFARVIGTDLQGRVLPVDDPAAAAAGSIGAARRRRGESTEIRDTLIAGIVVSHGADFATRNVRHFQALDIRVLDPWSE